MLKEKIYHSHVIRSINDSPFAFKIVEKIVCVRKKGEKIGQNAYTLEQKKNSIENWEHVAKMNVYAHLSFIFVDRALCIIFTSSTDSIRARSLELIRIYKWHGIECIYVHILNFNMRMHAIECAIFSLVLSFSSYETIEM